MEPRELAGTSSSLTESPNASEFMTRQQLLNRRASRLRRLAECYRHQYWLLMEDVHSKHRDFIWKFGKNSDDDVVQPQNGVVVAGDASGVGKLGLGFGEGGFNRCISPNCRFKAMALTNYCLSHILLDSKQVLYIGCQYSHRLIVNSKDGPLRCMTPVLRCTMPPLCPNHLKTYEQQIRRDMKKRGASTAAANKLASKFHLVITEYIRLIQTRRRAMRVNTLASKGSST